MPIRAAGAIVFDEHRRILLVRRARPPDAGFWSVPGGKCEPGETPADACVRETLEETGLSVVVRRLAGSVQVPAGDSEVFEVDDYLCAVVNRALDDDSPRPVARDLVAGDDASDVRWASGADLAAMELVPGLVRTLSSWGLMPD